MDYPKTYWADYGQRIIDALDLKQLSKGEYHGPCPACGGTDRFWISAHQGEVKVHCRQCGDFAAIQKALIEQGLWPATEPSRADNVLEFREREVRAEDFDGETYDVRKRIELHGAKLEGTTVVVPITNVNGGLVGHQRISPDGQKRFTSGMDKEAAFGVCGRIDQNKAYIAEGYATASSVYMATGVSCVFALDAGNLPKVCAEFARVFPDVELIVAADNDEPGIKAAKATGLKFAAPKQAGADWNDILVSHGRIAVENGLKFAKRQAALFTRASDIEMTPPKWLIEGMIEQDALGMVFGASGSGKTFVCLDFGLCVASGTDYHGKKVKQAPVLYIAGEGHAGFARRINAWTAQNNVNLEDVPFYKSNTTVIINDEKDAENMMAEIDALIEQVGTPGLIVLDTMDRTLAGSDSDDKDAAAYLNVCDVVRLKYGATVIVVHHTGHNHTERARGSTRLKGRLDCEYRVETWGDHKIILTPTKMKDAEEPPAMSFLKVSIELETTDGQKTDSLALEFTEDKPFDKKDPEHIKAVILEQIKKLDAFMEVPRSDLKEAVGLELECSQRTANRYIKKLIDDEVLSCVGGVVKTC